MTGVADTPSLTIVGSSTDYVTLRSTTVMRINAGSTLDLTHGHTFTNDEWQFFVVTRDSSNNSVAVWRGTSTVAPTVGGTTGTMDGDILIGNVGAYTDDSRFWDGMIDEVMVYNRKLSSAEISKNYKYSKGKHQ